MTDLPPQFAGTRFFRFTSWLKQRYPFKVYKIPIDAGFTCPNIDGTVAFGGCTYCLNESFSPNTRSPGKSIRDQIDAGMEFYRRRYHAEKFIAYFQAYSNTYGTVEHLRRVYDQALAVPDVVGLSIGTRPDCVPDPVLELITSYAERVDLWIEYGIQTMHDRTLDRVNRGHGWAEYRDAILRTRGRPMKVCTHLILGLPGETHAMTLETAEAVAELGLDGVKIHHAYVSPGTALAQEFRAGRYQPLDFATYVSWACDVLERLPATVVVQRLMGELSGPYVVAPLWGQSKQAVLHAIDAELARRGTWQGSRCAVRAGAV